MDTRVGDIEVREGRIRFSHHITIEKDGTVRQSFDVETPDRTERPEVPLATGIAIPHGAGAGASKTPETPIAPITLSKRGGRRPNAGRKPAKKAKKARRK